AKVSRKCKGGQSEYMEEIISYQDTKDFVFDCMNGKDQALTQYPTEALLLSMSLHLIADLTIMN
ncbi:MAG TPA: hypothetical protein H9970_04050, partial [Candidatus Merdibacter merdipullorum]|nr:hypothetical protein [Candidatus Merdibacter merdipullorum]